MRIRNEGTLTVHGGQHVAPRLIRTLCGTLMRPGHYGMWIGRTGPGRHGVFLDLPTEEEPVTCRSCLRSSAAALRVSRPA
jgi:hypothetical protein